jgi:hypothetical protein
MLGRAGQCEMRQGGARPGAGREGTGDAAARTRKVPTIGQGSLADQWGRGDAIDREGAMHNKVHSKTHNEETRRNAGWHPGNITVQI